VIKHLARIFLAGPPEDQKLEELVYRVSEMGESSDPWGRTIVEQSHGKSVREIVQVLYSAELGRGAGLVDIGMWKSLFDRSVLEAVGELARLGYVYLVPGGEQRRNDNNLRPAT